MRLNYLDYKDLSTSKKIKLKKREDTLIIESNEYSYECNFLIDNIKINLDCLLKNDCITCLYLDIIIGFELANLFIEIIRNNRTSLRRFAFGKKIHESDFMARIFIVLATCFKLDSIRLNGYETMFFNIVGLKTITKLDMYVDDSTNFNLLLKKLHGSATRTVILRFDCDSDLIEYFSYIQKIALQSSVQKIKLIVNSIIDFNDIFYTLLNSLNATTLTELEIITIGLFTFEEIPTSDTVSNIAVDRTKITLENIKLSIIYSNSDRTSTKVLFN